MSGSDWAGGYPVGRRYFDTLLPAMAPDSIDLALAVGRRRPPREGGAFRYAELGCGSAFTLAALAALHPEGRFFGADFLPEHVVRARTLIREAGLGNVEVEEASFAELAAAPAPERFDYIAIHGVWTWVSEENRAHLVALLDRWLNPGGVAYIAYNCAAGWSAAAPIRRIFHEAPAGPANAPLGPARKAVEDWLAVAAPQGTEEVWQRLSSLPDRYLAHDLGAPHNRPIWHAELVESLAPAKLDFAAPAHFDEPFDALRFGGEALAFVEQGVAGGWGELARDLVAGRTFRADLFCRGAPRLTAAESRRRLGRLRLAPWPAKLEAERRDAEEGGAEVLAGVAEQIEAQRAKGEQTLDEFAAGLDLPPVQALQMGLLSVATGGMRIVRPVEEAPREAVAGFLAALRHRWADGLAVPGLPAPRLGTVVALAPEEAAALFSEEGPRGEVAEGLARLGLP